VVLAVVAGLGGYRTGMVARATSWIGLAIGIVVALRLAPWLLDRTDGRRYELVLVVTLAVVVFVPLAGESIGWLLGRRVAPRSGRGAQADRVLGAVAGVAAVFATTWLLLPVARSSSGWSSDLVGGAIVSDLFEEHLPDPPPIDRALAPIVGRDRFPQLFDALQPPLDVPPPATSGLDDAVVSQAGRSVVLITGTACRLRVAGTGFVVGDSLVATNAHVVAGQRSPTVEREDGRRFPATVVVFDPRRDLALLTVPNLARPALSVGSSDRGDTGGVFGHPGGGALRIAPFIVTRQVDANGRDIYDRESVRREVLELAARLKQGDSGAPLVDAAGAVVGVAVSISSDHEGVAYALADSELRAVLDAPRAGAVSTGPCLQ
jgi:S1-C subfamily serine protease